MADMKKVKTGVWFFPLIIFVTGSSVISNRMWGGKPEKVEMPESVVIKSDMTLREFGESNSIPAPQLKVIFKLQSASDLDRKISEYGDEGSVSETVKKKMALLSEDAGKNWIKIRMKFASWFIFLLAVFLFIKNRKLTSSLRKTLQVAAVIIFGVILGSDPGPMGTVKDAVFLLGSAKTIFPPRMIALSVFLLLVVLANKYICAWGCQAGVLQDLIFRINRDDKDKPVIWRQFKPPFIITNSVRIFFFCASVAAAFVWSYDIVEPIDIFKIFNPVYLGIAGGSAVAVILVAGLFIYRPWCHFLCPFGLVGWIFEKFSIVKINVDYATCIACKKCANACPSTVMSAILLRDRKAIPDCFSCYTCRDVCPTGSIQFSAGRRTVPDNEKFVRKQGEV